MKVESEIKTLIEKYARTDRKLVKEIADSITDDDLIKLNTIILAYENALMSQPAGETTISYMVAKADLDEAARVFFAKCVRSLMACREAARDASGPYFDESEI